MIEATGQRQPVASDYYVNLQEDYGTVLHQFHRLHRNTSHPPIDWMRGHPDRDVLRKNGRIDYAIPRRDWGQAEYGIYIADHLADFTEEAQIILEQEGLLPYNIVRVPIENVLAAIPSRGQWLRTPLNTSNIPLLQPQREIADDKLFADHFQSQDTSSTRPARWTTIQTGLLRPSLRVLGALGWARKWAAYMRIILDRLPHSRNLTKGLIGPIAPCPLCHASEDTMEHLIRCEAQTIRVSRNYFLTLLLHDIRDYCTRHHFSTDTVTNSVAYAKACATWSLPATDAIGGWLGIPTPRFIYFYSPDKPISGKTGKEMMQVLPRIVAESIKWLQQA